MSNMNLHSESIRLSKMEKILRFVKLMVTIWFVGMVLASVIIGPKEKSVPPVAIWSSFDEAREIVGAGNIFFENEAPKIHLHAVAGNSMGLTMGCIRKEAEAFMVLEVFIIETDIKAERVFNEKIGFSPIIF